jgi:hypothetical protein
MPLLKEVVLNDISGPELTGETGNPFSLELPIKTRILI